MTTDRTMSSLTRRTAIAGFGATGLGLALTAPAHAQDATPIPMAGHPIIGTWLVDRQSDAVTDAPTINIMTADGAVIDPVFNVGGAWQEVGPRTAAATLYGVIDGGQGGYLVVRSLNEVDDTGMHIMGPYTVTIVAPGGTVVMTADGAGRATRLPVQPMEDGGTPLPGIAPWTPETPGATPGAATPAR
jgi:hypothetical protein